MQARQRNQRKRGKRSSRQLDVESKSPGKPFTPLTRVGFGPIIGFPDVLHVRLKYVETISFSGSATPAAQVYRMNDLHDPNLTGVGHQPDYYDQLTAIYGRWCVLASQAEVTVYNTTAAMGLALAANYSDAVVSGLNVEALSESKFSRTANTGYGGSGKPNVVINMPAMTTAQITGQREIESDPNFYTSVGSSPGDPWYLTLKMQSVDGVTTIVAYARFVLIFDCIFKELTNPGESLKSNSKKPSEVTSQCCKAIEPLKCQEVATSIAATPKVVRY